MNWLKRIKKILEGVKREWNYTHPVDYNPNEGTEKAKREIREQLPPCKCTDINFCERWCRAKALFSLDTCVHSRKKESIIYAACGCETIETTCVYCKKVLDINVEC